MCIDIDTFNHVKLNYRSSMAASSNLNQVPTSSIPPYDVLGLYKPSQPQPDMSYPPPQQYPFHFPNYPQNPHLQNHHNNIPQRSLSYPTPPLQPSPNSGGAHIMALLRTPSSSSNPESTVPSTAPVMEFPAGLVGPPRMPSSKVPRGRRLAGDTAVVEYDVDVRMPGEAQPQLEVTPITKYGSDPQLFVGRQIAVNKVYICYGLKQGNVRVLNSNNASRALFRGHGQRVTDMAFFAEDVHLLASVSIDGRVNVWKISEEPEEGDEPVEITGNIVIAVQIVGEGDVVHPRVCWHCHKQEVLVVGIGKCILRIDTTKFGKGEVYSAEAPLQCPVEKLIDGIQIVGKHDGEVTDLSICQWMITRLVSASMDGTIKIWEDRKAQPLAVLRPYDGQPVYSASFLTASDRPDHIILITGGPLNRELKIWSLTTEEGWLLPGDADSWKCTQTLALKSSAATQVEDAFFNQVASMSHVGLLLLANAKKKAIYVIHLEYGPNPAATRMDYIAEFTVTMPVLSFTGICDMLPRGICVPQIYCFQTQAIQQYTLDLYQCLPPPLENVCLEMSRSNISQDASNCEELTAFDPYESKTSEVPVIASAPKPIAQVGSSESGISVRYPPTSDSVEATSLPEIMTSNLESKSVSLAPAIGNTDIGGIRSSPLPSSPRLSRKLSGFRMPLNSLEAGVPPSDLAAKQPSTTYSGDQQNDNTPPKLYEMPSFNNDSAKDESKGTQADNTNLLAFRHPTHLITPSEILMAASSSDVTSLIEGKSEVDANTQDVAVNSDGGNAEVEVKVVGETSSCNDEFGPHGEPCSRVSENKEKFFCSQASDLGIEVARQSSAISEYNLVEEEPQQVDSVESEILTQLSRADDEIHDSMKDMSVKFSESVVSTAVRQSPSPSSKGKKQKGRNSQASGALSPSVLNSADSSNGPAGSSNPISVEAALPQVQEKLSQLMHMQKETQKQMSNMVAISVSKECRKLEAALGRAIEKAVKANNDALWARMQEENSKNEKLLRERTQQMSNLFSSFMNNDLMAMLEKVVKKEVTAIGQIVIHTVTPIIEKTIASAIADSFQRGVGDKAVNQLEKSVNVKLEATVARQIQAQFQTYGKQALQDTLKAGIEASIIPGFETSCKAIFGQIETAFQKGMVEHTNAAQQQFDTGHSQLAILLRDTINTASSVTQTLSTELADGQRKLFALAAAGANPNVLNPLVTQLSNGYLGGQHEKVEGTLDPKQELSRLISECKYDEAFMIALQISDLSIISWLCYQVDLQAMLSKKPPPLSQPVLLSLLQHLAFDINTDIPRKLDWMTSVAIVINPADETIIANAMHFHNIIDQVYKILHNLLSSPNVTDKTRVRALIFIVDSLMMKM
ncbi:enhancer of mRNA-decapping protein 4 [Tripterygium wilfordii]|uniref:Enhancer of mRNA-decapping protein 4 n=1 Tax=Tripterygium wilfordii TaxID=458696 RepID=A0A7J7C2W4_TRIWF|nr:enhancer of mRNA-decapping protein 4-like [Tripterygium wilfordii]KAF5728499.1 enhancer of mRNA-decapping protein 4 [Tripterygium wilfordii]